MGREFNETTAYNYKNDPVYVRTMYGAFLLCYDGVYCMLVVAFILMTGFGLKTQSVQTFFRCMGIFESFWGGNVLKFFKSLTCKVFMTIISIFSSL